MTLYKKIVLMAQKDKASVEKKKELAIIDDYNYRQRAYLYSRSILTPGVNITSRPVAKPTKAFGNKINTIISKKDYIDMAKRLVEFVEKNKQFPNWIRYSSYKVSPALYCYEAARIVIATYNNKGKLPDSCRFNSKVFNKSASFVKHGRSTEYGCDNRGQNNGYFCGPHMVQEIIRNLTGEVISQSTLAEVIGTTGDGSDHEGLNFAFEWFNRNYNYELDVSWKNFSELGWSGIKKILESNNQDCGIHELYRNTWGHYTNFDRIYDSYADVHNSLGDSCNRGCYCGYTEERSLSTAQSYLNGISQKSVIVVTRTK